MKKTSVNVTSTQNEVQFNPGGENASGRKPSSGCLGNAKLTRPARAVVNDQNSSWISTETKSEWLHPILTGKMPCVTAEVVGCHSLRAIGFIVHDHGTREVCVRKQRLNVINLTSAARYALQQWVDRETRWRLEQCHFTGIVEVVRWGVDETKSKEGDFEMKVVGHVIWSTSSHQTVVKVRRACQRSWQPRKQILHFSFEGFASWFIRIFY